MFHIVGPEADCSLKTMDHLAHIIPDHETKRYIFPSKRLLGTMDSY
jgi:hypothetical protein